MLRSSRLGRSLLLTQAPSKTCFATERQLVSVCPQRVDQNRRLSVTPPRPGSHHGASSTMDASKRRASRRTRTPRANKTPAPAPSSAAKPHDSPADAKPSAGGSKLHGSTKPGETSRAAQLSRCSCARTKATAPSPISPAPVAVISDARLNSSAPRRVPSRESSPTAGTELASTGVSTVGAGTGAGCGPGAERVFVSGEAGEASPAGLDVGCAGADEASTAGFEADGCGFEADGPVAVESDGGWAASFAAAAEASFGGPSSKLAVRAVARAAVGLGTVGLGRGRS